MPTEHGLSANEAACVTKVPLRQVHRIVDAGLLGDVARSRRGVRTISGRELVALKLAYEAINILTLKGRQRLIRQVLDDPESRTVREGAVSVDLQSTESEVRQGLALLENARDMVQIDEDILDGTPCIKGTRIPVHDIAEMVAAGDEIAAIRAAYPALADGQVEAAVLYANAYPLRGRPRRKPDWRSRKPIAASLTAFDDLPENP